MKKFVSILAVVLVLGVSVVLGAPPPPIICSRNCSPYWAEVAYRNRVAVSAQASDDLALEDFTLIEPVRDGVDPLALSILIEPPRYCMPRYFITPYRYQPFLHPYSRWYVPYRYHHTYSYRPYYYGQRYGHGHGHRK